MLKINIKHFHTLKLGWLILAAFMFAMTMAIPGAKAASIIDLSECTNDNYSDTVRCCNRQIREDLPPQYWLLSKECTRKVECVKRQNRNYCYVRPIPVPKDCPRGTTWNGKRCVPIIILKPCPPGYVRSNGKCIRIVIIKPCPPGTYRSKGQCLPVIRVRPIDGQGGANSGDNNNGDGEGL